MKKLLFILFFVPALAFAQEWNVAVDAGVGFNYLSSNLETSNSAQIGVKAGATVSYTTWFNLLAETGVSYLNNKGGKIYLIDLQHKAVNSIDAKMQDLRFPINFGYVVYITDEWSFTPKVGAWFAWGVGGRSHIRATDEKGNEYKVSYNAYDAFEYAFDKETYYIGAFKKFDVGVSVGIDFRYTNLAIRAKCDIGLKNLNPSLENPQSRCYAIMLGYFF